MIDTSAEYKNAVVKNENMWRYKISINGVEYFNFNVFNFKAGIIASDSINLGESVSSYIDVTLNSYINPVLLDGQKVLAYAGLYTINNDVSSIEWIKLGVFNIVSPTIDGMYVTFTAYDNMMLAEQGLFTNLSGMQPISAILDEQCKKLGIAYSGGDDGSSINVDKLKGITLRKAIELCASYCGKNAVMDRNGNLKLKWFEDTGLEIPARIIAEPLQIDERDYSITGLACAIGDEKDTILHSGSDAGIEIQFSNQCVTQEHLNVIMQKLKDIKYRPCNLQVILGRPDIEVGDIIYVYDLRGNKYKIPIFIMDITFDGGCPINITASVKSDTESKFQFQGELSTKIERNYTELISAKEILAETITAWSGNFHTIETEFLKVNGELQAYSGKFGSIESEIAILKTADIENLNALTAKINSAEIGIADITTIINRFTTSDSIHSLLINADTAIIADATIKSAMIDTLEFRKLTGIDINTTDLKIHSKDGMSQWYDNTIQINDSRRIRVQIGKDASSDYNMYIWDVDGNLMFDAMGIKASGIKDKIIRDDMISENADISGSKIDITSVVTEINNGSTSIISNRILYDGKSLDIAFKTVTDGIDTVKTELQAQQGKVSILISDMTQSKDDITSMKTDFSSFQQELGSVKIIVSSHESSISGVNGKVTSLEANINGFKSTVASTYATIVDVNKLPQSIQDKMLGAGTPLPSGADLNTYKTAGVYTTANMNSVTNIPDGIQSNCELRLIVEYIGSSSYLQQTLIYTYTGTFRGAWKRTGSTLWRPWNIITDSTNVVSCINQTAETIKIQASKIDLTGYVTLTNLSTSGQTIIDGGNIRTGTITSSHIKTKTLESITINSGSFNTVGGKNYAELSSGSLRLKNDNVLVGYIGTNQYTNDASKKGLDFDLEYDGSYMTWAYKNSPYASTYTMKLTYCSRGLSNYTYSDSLYLGCDLDTSNYDVYINKNRQVRLVAYNDGAGFAMGLNYRFTVAGNNETIMSCCKHVDTNRYIDFYGQLNMKGFPIVNQSDVRLKENIKPTYVNGLDIINSLNLVEYDWMTDGKHEKIGLIAQQLMSVCPDLVHSDTDGIMGINYTGLIVYLIKAIQEMSNKTTLASTSSSTQIAGYKNLYTDDEKTTLLNRYNASKIAVGTNKKDMVMNKKEDGVVDFYEISKGSDE